MSKGHPKHSKIKRNPNPQRRQSPRNRSQSFRHHLPTQQSDQYHGHRRSMDIEVYFHQHPQTEASITSPKFIRFLARLLTALDWVERDCPICMEPYWKNDMVVTGECNHSFCTKCVNRLCQNQFIFSCPLCRANVTELKNNKGEVILKLSERPPNLHPQAGDNAWMQAIEYYLTRIAAIEELLLSFGSPAARVVSSSVNPESPTIVVSRTATPAPPTPAPPTPTLDNAPENVLTAVAAGVTAAPRGIMERDEQGTTLGGIIDMRQLSQELLGENPFAPPATATAVELSAAPGGSSGEERETAEQMGTLSAAEIDEQVMREWMEAVAADDQPLPQQPQQPQQPQSQQSQQQPEGRGSREAHGIIDGLEIHLYWRF